MAADIFLYHPDISDLDL